jgi:hypothetical protein
MLAKLQTVLTKGGHHIGDICFWQLADARVDRATLERIWLDANLDVGLLPEEPTDDRALKQAVREAQVGRRDRLVRLGLDSEVELVFAVVRETRDDQGNVSYAQEARLHLERASGTLTTDRPGHDVVQAVLKGFAVLRATHTSDDVRKAIVRALGSWASVALRDGGGVYWVPASYAEQLRSLRSAVERLGSSKVHVLPVHQSPDSDKSLGAIATAALEAELAALQTEIAAFLTAPPDRVSTLTRRLEAFEALRERARLYRSVLSITVSDLDEQLLGMTATVEQLLAKRGQAA